MNDIWVIMSYHELSICLDEHPGLPFHGTKKNRHSRCQSPTRQIAGAEDPQFAPGGFKILGHSAAFWVRYLRRVWQLYDRYDTSVCWLWDTLGLWGGYYDYLWLIPHIWPSNNGSNDIYCIYLYITIKWGFPKVRVPLNCPKFLNHPCS